MWFLCFCVFVLCVFEFLCFLCFCVLCSCVFVRRSGASIGAARPNGASWRRFGIGATEALRGRVAAGRLNDRFLSQNRLLFNRVRLPCHVRSDRKIARNGIAAPAYYRSTGGMEQLVQRLASALSRIFACWVARLPPFSNKGVVNAGVRTLSAANRGRRHTDGHGGEKRGHEEVVARGHADDLVAEGIQASHDSGGAPARAEDDHALFAHTSALQEQVLDDLPDSGY